MIKVLQINAVYGHGSTGTIVRDIEHLCQASGIECYVASADPKVREARHSFVIGNVFDHKIHALLCRFKGKQAYYSSRATRKLLSYIDMIKPDVIHIHNIHNNYINFPLLFSYISKHNIATVITLHDCWFYTGGCFYYTIAGCNKWKVRCGRCPKKLLDTPAYLKDCSSELLEDKKRLLLSIPRLLCIGVSEWITNEAKQSFLKNNNVVTILNGIDLNVFKPTPSDVRARLGLKGKYVLMGLASKWLSKENINALDLFSSKMRDDEVLFLYGADNLHLKTPPHVFLYGFTQNREELASLYTMADIFVNCSREDALSLINLEAQACGTPVVTYDGSGPAETVNNRDSFSVHVGDADALYKRVEYIRKNYSKDTSHRCIAFVKEKFGLLENYNKYIHYYTEIVKE